MENRNNQLVETNLNVVIRRCVNTLDCLQFC